MPSNVAALTGLLCLASSAAVCDGSRLGKSASAKDRPVAKVVRLLQDMKVQLEKEMADDKEVYESIDCWCETNEKEKTKAIADGEAKAEDLKSEHGEFFAKIGELKTNIESTREKIEADQTALDTATEMRMKEVKLFHGEETDTLQAISACKSAIIVLSKHHPSLTQVRAVAKSLEALQAMPGVSGALGRGKQAIIQAFVRSAQDDREQAAFLHIPGFQSYAPQSGQVLGILKQMQEDFENSLSEAQKGELKAQEDFAALKEAKEAELKAGRAQLAQLREDLAAFGEKLAEAWEELQNVQEQLRLDNIFLHNLRKTCSASDREWEERSKARQAELVAVTETIAYLNSDEAFDLFDKTLNTALLQLFARGAGGPREQAAAALRRAGAPELVLLATSVQKDAFTKVIAAIDKMTAELKKQQQEEVEHRDWCIGEMNTNKLETERTLAKKESLEAHIESTKKEIESMAAEILERAQVVNQTEVEMVKASEVREKEHADFEESVTDARLTQAVLKKARDRMAQVYFLQEPGAPHVQLSANKTDPGTAPARFSKYEKNAGGTAVLGMLDKIIQDAETLELQAMQDEDNAQREYELFMKNSNDLIVGYQKAIADLTENKAKAEGTLAMAEGDLEEADKDLGDLGTRLGDLKGSCDFSLRNFDARQAARAAEIDALAEAKAYLAGMK